MRASKVRSENVKSIKVIHSPLSPHTNQLWFSFSRSAQALFLGYLFPQEREEMFSKSSKLPRERSE